ncbi:hypothetical protein PCASD_04133 [Puccinia coronata f. sp. avenae]|uniref:Uncharacterized protein n=1 Tax=Puccinia coronata f. sp. avenae TaxID=200324 RepID=A0A2N5V852_9BASI|nr:hypothetical protein PCASD_04133 [Puccinia coronata f. sp. avenae]
MSGTGTPQDNREARVWTNEKDRFVLEKVQKIAKDHPREKNQLSFVHLRNLLNGVTLPGGNYPAETRSTGVTLDPSCEDKSDTVQLEPIVNHNNNKKEATMQKTKKYVSNNAENHKSKEHDVTKLNSVSNNSIGQPRSSIATKGPIQEALPSLDKPSHGKRLTLKLSAPAPRRSLRKAA